MNPYTVLGLPPDASAEEIHAAYRSRALELHPDRCAEGADPFFELQEAYGALADPKRRSTHAGGQTRQAEPLVPADETAEPLHSVEQAASFRDVPLFDSFETFHPSVEELMDRWFDNFSGRTPPKAETVEGLTVDVPLSPEQAELGGEVHVDVPARMRCRSCTGQGHVGDYLCWRCGGTGAVTGDVPIRLHYPAGLLDPYIVRLPLERLGIRNFYLTVRFRVSDSECL